MGECCNQATILHVLETKLYMKIFNIRHFKGFPCLQVLSLDQLASGLILFEWKNNNKKYI